MGLQAIDATPRNGNPVSPRDQDAGEMHTAHWAARQDVSFQGQGASIAFFSNHRPAGSKKVEGPRRAGRTVARASAAVGACILWLAVGAVADEGRCGESSVRARADAAQGKAAQARQPALAGERKPAPESEQERDRAEAPARALTSSLREELEAVRSAAETARIEQSHALDQERDRADILARELDAARIDSYLGTVQAAEAEIKHKQALDQERDRANALGRELGSLRTELEAARAAGSKAEQAADAESKQKQALDQERGRADALARELGSLRTELDAARAIGSEAVQAADAERKQKQTLEQKLRQEREGAEVLARELAAARKEAEDRSARLAAAHAEVLQVTEANRATAAEQKLALVSERDRADAVTRELIFARNELEAANRQIAAFSAVETVGSTSGRSSVVESPRPQAQPTVLEAASDVDPKVVIGTGRSTSASTASRSPLDEQRLLARANALLRQADISAARPLLEYALERGSARAAFMLAETYDARVLQSWRARGISGDPTKARELYERAEAGGIEDARDRIETLK